MKGGIYISNLSELPLINGHSNEIRKKICCITVDDKEAIRQFSSATYLDAVISILVLSGNADISVNYRTFQVFPHTLLLLSSSHLFQFKNCSQDFKCQCLFVSKDFINEMDSTDMINRRTKYGVRLYNTPVLSMTTDDAGWLLQRMTAIDRTIDRTEHSYHKEAILNSIFAFYLDLSDIIDRDAEMQSGSNLTRYESIIQTFIELLATHYREEHKVDFYASKLNLSAHYLTLIVKRVTGQSACDFIYEMLFSEARNLLTHSKLSVQEIATALNFSDQSSFGKFFKRKAGISPMDFRKD